MPNPRSAVNKILRDIDTHDTSEALLQKHPGVYFRPPQVTGNQHQQVPAPFRKTLQFLLEIHLDPFFRRKPDPGRHHLAVIPDSGFFSVKFMDRFLCSVKTTLRPYDFPENLKFYYKKGREGFRE